MTEANLSAKVTADIADFSKKMDSVQGSIDRMAGGSARSVERLTNQVEASAKAFSTLAERGAALQSLGTKISTFVTLPITGIGLAAIKTASDMEQAKIAFTTLLGSGEKASAFLQELQNFAASTPFQFTELQDASKKMLALGFDAKEIIPTLTNVGNAVSALGGDSGTFNRIVLALGQINAKGKLSSQEMQQLAEAGIPAWEALAKAIGVTVPEAMELAQKGAISSQTAIAAIQGDLSTRFAGLMEAQSGTVAGTFSNLQDTITFILADLGAEITKTFALKDVIVAVGDAAKSVLSWFRGLDDGTKELVLVLTGAFAASGPILVAVGLFMTALASVTAPMLATGMIVLGIIGGVALIVTKWKAFKTEGLAIWDSVKTSIVGTAKGLYEGIVEWLVNKLSAVTSKVQGIVELVAKPFEWLKNHLVDHSVVPDMVRDIGRHMQNLDVAMTAPARNATVATAKIFEGLAFTTQDAMNQVVSTINFAWGSATQGVSQALAQMTTAQVNWAQVGIQIGQQFLSAMINQIISLMTQWALAAVFGQKAHTAMETAKTAATVAGNAARLGTTLATNKAMLASVTTTIAGFGAVGNAAMAVMAAALEGVVAFMMAVAASVSYVPIVGQALAGAIIVGATTAQLTGAAGIIAATAALNVALGGATVAATTALATPLASGGIVTGPTFALIGEAGPEAVIPLSRAGGFGDRRPTHVHVHLNGREIALAVADDLPGALRTMGVPA